MYEPQILQQVIGTFMCTTHYGYSETNYEQATHQSGYGNQQGNPVYEESDTGHDLDREANVFYK